MQRPGAREDDGCILTVIMVGPGDIVGEQVLVIGRAMPALRRRALHGGRGWPWPCRSTASRTAQSTGMGSGMSLSGAVRRIGPAVRPDTYVLHHQTSRRYQHWGSMQYAIRHADPRTTMRGGGG